MPRKKTDVLTELGHAVLDARHNGTPPERVEASRLTLLGKLPPLPSYVALMTETPWAQVAQVAISPEGKIAVLGIEKNGTKEIVEWTVIDRRWTSRVIASTGGNMHVDHLHYPEGSEEVAFTVTGPTLQAPNGGTRVFWGDWNFDAVDSTTGKIESIYPYLSHDIHPWPCCIVVFSAGGNQRLQRFKEGGGRMHLEITALGKVSAKHLKVLGHLCGQIIVHAVSETNKASIFFLNLDDGEVWHSAEYDQILEDSIMEREGEISLVGWNRLRPMGQEGSGVFLESTRSKKSLDHDDQSGKIYCLPSGRILVRDGCVDLGWVLHDVNTNKLITLLGVREFSEIVEIPSGLVVRVIKYDGSHALLVIHENWDSVPGLLHAFQADEIRSLRRWGDHLVFEISERGSESIRVVRVEDLEEWLVETDDVRYAGPIATYPLYTPFERLVYTEEGILSWHFVNGTMYIIRYPL